MPTYTDLLTTATIVGTGTMTGLFYAFSTSVLPGLRTRPAPEAAAAMAAMNDKILNPGFLSVYVGTAVACAATAVVSVVGDTPGAVLRVAGAAAYLIGAFAVTAAVNVPLNNALAATEPASEDRSTVWTTFARRWTAYNHVRGVASAAATALLALSRS